MTTIKDIARKAHVSIATVSNVLNEKGTVKPETAQRVRAAAIALRYSKNISAEELAQGRRNMVGLIISDIKNPFFPDVTKGFQDLAFANGMDALVLNTAYDPHRTLTSVRRLISLRVPGVAILTSEIDRSVVGLLVEGKIASVYLDHGEIGPWTSIIKVDYAGGIESAVAHLRSLGHERIGFIGGPRQLKSARVRKDAFLEVVQDESLVIDSDFRFEGGYVACAELLRRVQPSAVVAANDLMAIGAMRYAQDIDMRLPDELSIVGFDNVSFTEFTRPTLTTVSLPRERLGAMAFTALENLWQRDGVGKQFELETRLVIRGSTGRTRLSGALLASPTTRLQSKW